MDDHLYRHKLEADCMIPLLGMIESYQLDLPHSFQIATVSGYNHELLEYGNHCQNKVQNIQGNIALF